MQRITVVSVQVSDQERAKRFYTAQVGFELLADATWGDEQRWVQVGPRDGQASLALVTWFDEMPAGSLRGLVLDCDDLAADYESMTDRGVRFTGPPQEQAGGVFAILVDPDENRLSLRQAETPAELETEDRS